MRKRLQQSHRPTDALVQALRTLRGIREDLDPSDSKPSAIAEALRDVGCPALLKTARFGYDGKGQARVDDIDSAHEAFATLGGTTCVLEERVTLQSEISVVLARGVDGEVRCYPVTENRHRDGILDVSLVPARVDEAVRVKATAIATAIAAWMHYVVKIAQAGGTLNDPLAAEILVQAKKATDAEGIVEHLLGLEKIFGRDLPQHAGFRQELLAKFVELAKNPSVI